MNQEQSDPNAPAKSGSEGQSENKPVDEMFLVNQTKTQSIVRCMRLLRFL